MRWGGKKGKGVNCHINLIPVVVLYSAVFFGRVEHRGRSRPAQHLVRIQHDVRGRVTGQFLFLERRVTEVRVDLRAALDDGGRRVRMRQRDTDLVELGEVLVAPLLGRGQLQHAGLHGDADGRQRDAVLVGEVGDRLHRRVVAHQVVRKVAERGHALHVLLALGPVPDGQQRPDAGARDVDIARQQRVVDGRAARQLDPLDLGIHALRLRMLLDQLLILRDVEQKIDDAELLRDADLPFRMRSEAPESQADAGNQREGCTSKTVHSRPKNQRVRG